MRGNIRPDPRFRRPERLVFGIGAAKCGTSWLNALLRAHPKIHVAHQRELHYWDVVRPPSSRKPMRRARERLDALEGLPALQRLVRAPALRYYRSAARMREAPDICHSHYADVLFSRYRGEPVAAEVTPAYALLDADTFAEIASLNEDCRFVFVMRDPIDRLHAGIRHRLRKQEGNAAVTEARVLQELLDDPEGVLDGNLARSDYARTIRHLESAVHSDRIHYAFFETLFCPDTVAGLFSSLGLENIATDTDRKRNEGAATGTPMAPAFRDHAARRLAHVYRFVRSKFGERVPEPWLDLG